MEKGPLLYTFTPDKEALRQSHGSEETPTVLRDTPGKRWVPGGGGRMSTEACAPTPSACFSE